MDSMTTPPPAPGETFNFAEHLFEANRSRRDRTAFIDDAGTLSYGDLEQHARRFAQALVDAGLRQEERLLLLMHDTSDWPVVFLGCLYAGVVPVAVNTLLTADDYAYMIGHCRARAIVVSAALLPVVQAALAKAPHDARRVVVSRPASPLPAGAIAFDAFLARDAASVPAATTPDDVAFWLYSDRKSARLNSSHSQISYAVFCLKKKKK